MGKLIEKLSRGPIFRKEIAQSFETICSFIMAGTVSVQEPVGESILNTLAQEVSD